MDWLRADNKEVVSLDVLDSDQSQLQAEVLKLRARVKKLRSVLRLLAVLLNVSGFNLVNQRLPEERQKLRVLRAIDHARKTASLRTVLRVLGLSSARYHAWRRLQEGCALDDQSSCPRTSPQRLTLSEIRTIKQMVTSPNYRHVPAGTLAILAQRLGKVFASPTTWCRLVREYGWRRPRLRVHPVKPKVGLRATRADETWHIDTTIIRLLDGSKAYLHAIIDNFSRRILAWRVAESFSPGNSVAILVEAAKGASKSSEPPAVLTDGGTENINSHVDDLIERGVLRRILAFADLKFSNSMIEAWWRVFEAPMAIPQHAR